MIDAMAREPRALERRERVAAVTRALGSGEATSVLLSRIALALPEQAIISAFEID